MSNGKTSDNKRVPVISPDYRKVSYTSFLGSKNTPGTFQTAPVLKAGAHLHFILPDAFTHAGEDGYPAVPNRYIVTRLYADGSGERVITKCFMVESDFMSTDAAYADSITIPRFQEKDLRKNWRYLGRSYSLSDGPGQDKYGEYLEKLTAVGAGDPMFAAYYPSCSSVFGFYDDLRDVPLNTSVSYFVVGYYGDAADDRFSRVKTAEDFRKLLAEMNFSVPSAGEPCSGCVLFGEISGILWKGTEEEYDAPSAGEIRVAVGNTSAEALSAAVVHTMGLNGDAERFLTALQYDLADSAELSDGNYKIDDEIFLRQFHRLESGRAGVELVLSPHKGTDEDGPVLGKRFSDFVKADETLSRLKRELESARNRLFYAWEQYMLCYEDPRFLPKDAPAKQEMLKEIHRIIKEDIKGLEERISAQEKIQSRCSEGLEEALGENVAVTETPGGLFYVSKDPVLLFYGPGMKRAYAFGEDGRFTNDGTLACQTEVVRANVSPDILKDCLCGASFPESLPKEYEQWLYQGALLSKDARPVIEKKAGKVEITGNVPSEVAQNVYHKEPITLFMAWEAEYLPTETGTEPEKALDGWEYREDDIGYHYAGGMTPPQLQKEYISGRTVLTPHAALQLSESLKRWLETHPGDKQMAEIAEKIRDLAVVSQNLDSFTKAMLSLRQTFQFPVMGAGGDEETVQEVSEQAPSERASVIPDGALRHLRGGMFGIHRIDLIGTFGQTQYVADSSYFGETEITFSETMERVDKNHGLMPPAFQEPVRIRFRFVSAADDGVIASPAPETSPVCGIVLPELLNKRLMIYDADGTCIGCVGTAYEKEKKVARWIDANDPERSFSETAIRDQRLRGFLQGLLDVEGALADILRLIDSYYEKKLIPHTEKLIWGRPFVLARCSVQFEFSGTPEYDKRFSAFGRYDTRGAEKISFPVMIGDMERVTDGVLGCFDDVLGYDRLCPAFGAAIGQKGGYLRPQDSVRISADAGEKLLSVLMDGHAAVHIQTGLMPDQAQFLYACHGAAADEILAAAEMNPVIASADGVALPMRGYGWKYRAGGEFIQQKIVPLCAGFDETVIMDGFMVKEKQDE